MPDPYHLSRLPPSLRANCFHGKNTQCCRHRKPSQRELDRLERVKRLLENNPKCESNRRAYGLK
jgi:hypothetical protein